MLTCSLTIAVLTVNHNILEQELLACIENLCSIHYEVPSGA